MAMAKWELPYEAQENSRFCGPACLSMVYRSFGLNLKQEEIWPKVTLDNDSGATYLLAKDACERGFDAVVMQASEPEIILERSLRFADAVILNHRFKRSSENGHFSVLRGIDGGGVLLHDPIFGPNRRLDWRDFLELWSRNHPQSAAGDQILVAISREAPKEHQCERCGNDLPETSNCPKCNRDIRLRPGGVIGCIRPECGGRYWQNLFCPHCEQGLKDASFVDLRGFEHLKEKYPLEAVQLYAATDKVSKLLTDRLPTIDVPAVREDLEYLLNRLREEASSILNLSAEEATAYEEYQSRSRADDEAFLAQVRELDLENDD